MTKNKTERQEHFLIFYFILFIFFNPTVERAAILHVTRNFFWFIALESFENNFQA